MLAARRRLMLDLDLDAAQRLWMICDQKTMSFLIMWAMDYGGESKICMSTTVNGFPRTPPSKSGRPDAGNVYPDSTNVTFRSLPHRCDAAAQNRSAHLRQYRQRASCRGATD